MSSSPPTNIFFTLHQNRVVDSTWKPVPEPFPFFLHFFLNCVQKYIFVDTLIAQHPKSFVKAYICVCMFLFSLLSFHFFFNFSLSLYFFLFSSRSFASDTHKVECVIDFALFLCVRQREKRKTRWRTKAVNIMRMEQGGSFIFRCESPFTFSPVDSD